jgi:uncharacterized protein DUF6894
MPTYTFELDDAGRVVNDEVGVVLPDRDHALAYACRVTRELMVGRERQTWFWSLRVSEDGGEPIFEVPFVKVDRTLQHLPPELKGTIERAWEQCRSLQIVIRSIQATVRESIALVARSQGKPHLATLSGEPTIRK